MSCASGKEVSMKTVLAIIMRTQTQAPAGLRVLVADVAASK